jgi:hypothetical protein
MTTLDAQLRAAIRRSGASAYRLAEETKVPQPTITRFLNGADMKLSTASKVARHLKLRLVKSK